MRNLLKLTVCFAGILGFAGCNSATTSASKDPSGPSLPKSVVSYDGTPNSTYVGELSAGGTIEMNQGEKRWIYGARAKRCAADAPSFKEAIDNLGRLPDGLGKIYDAGVGDRFSASCNGKVKARAVGLEPYKDFTGQAKLTFYGQDTVTLVIKPAKTTALSKK